MKIEKINGGVYLPMGLDAEEYLEEDLFECPNQSKDDFVMFTFPAGTRIAISDDVPVYEEDESLPEKAVATIIECTEETKIICTSEEQDMQETKKIGYVDGEVYLSDSETLIAIGREPMEYGSEEGSDKIFKQYCKLWNVSRIIYTP